MPASFLITGICGFAGSSIAEALLEYQPGASISGIDNLSRPGSEINRRRLARLSVRVHHGDLRCASDLESLPKAACVIDAAANPSVLAGVDGNASTRQLFEHNLLGTMNVLEYCRRHGAALVLLSSSRVYSIPALASLSLAVSNNAFVLDPSAPWPPGLSAEGVNEDFSTEAPVSLYGSSKLASEILALEYGSTFNFPVWINRCGVLAGAGQFGTASQGIFSYWIHSHLRRKPLRYIGFEGKGWQVRDALHPRDLTSLVLAQFTCGRSGGRRLYTVGGGCRNAISLAQLTDWCNQRFGTHTPTPAGESRVFDIPWLVMDSTRAANDFRWHRAIGIHQILEELACHAERNPEWLELSSA